MAHLGMTSSMLPSLWRPGRIQFEKKGPRFRISESSNIISALFWDIFNLASVSLRMARLWCLNQAAMLLMLTVLICVNLERQRGLFPDWPQ